MDDLPTKPARDLRVAQARFTFLWPLTLHPARPLSEPRVIETAVQDTFERIDRDEPTWQRVDDPLAHVPPPDRAEFAVGKTGDDEYSRAVVAWENAGYAETVYFHDHVQSFLFRAESSGSDAQRTFRLFRRTDIAKVQVEWGGASKILDVARVNLYLFRTGTLIVAMEVATSTSGESWTLAEVQDFHDYFRRAYAPFFVHDSKRGTADRAPGGLVVDRVVWLDASGAPLSDGRGVPVDFRTATSGAEVAAFMAAAPAARTPPVFAHWRFVLPRSLVLAADGSEDARRYHWHHSVDERMPSLAFVSLADDASYRSIRPGDWIRLCFADASGDADHPYDPDFSAGLAGEHAYDRFRSFGVRYLISGYALTAVGHGWFFDSVVSGHMRRHYFQMLLLAHLEHAGLLAISSHIAEAMRRRETTGDEQAFEIEISAIQGLFLQIAHRFRFRDVSNQVQAQEIYAMIRRRLGLDGLYEGVRQELGDSNQFLQSRSEIRTAASEHRLNILATTGGVIGVALAAGGSTLLERLAAQTAKAFGYEGTSEFVKGLWHFSGLALVLSGMGLIGYLTLYFVRHWSQSGELGSGDQGWRDPQRVFESVLGWSSASLLGLGVVTLLAAIGFG